MQKETLFEANANDLSQQKTMKRITGVACINIPVSDLDSSIQFYVDRLGCTLVRDATETSNSGANAFIKFGEGPTALLHEEKAPYHIHFVRDGEPVPFLELLTEDIKALFHTLKSEGVIISGAVDENECGDRFQVTDPDGNKILIVQC